MSLQILIIEDEPATARNLAFMIKQANTSANILEILTSVSDSIEWLSKNEEYDLLFMDIRLSDGLSFEIFKKIKIKKPVVFITAYDEYALEAFKANGIDYILKPFDSADLAAAFEKISMLQKSGHSVSENKLQQLTDTLQANVYKQSFLIQFRDKLIPVSINEIAWFYTKNEIVYLCTTGDKKYTIDSTLEQLQQQLDPNIFYRANRQFIVHRKAIREINFYFNGRLIVNTEPEPEEKIIVSKARVKQFKFWMNQ